MNDNAALLSKLGLPLFLIERKERFEHWLMHGAHPEDITLFNADHIPADERPLVLQLLRAYLDAGFRDPGIAILRDEEWDLILGREERR